MFSVQQLRCIYEYDSSEGLCFCWEWICWLQAHVGRWGVGFPQIHHEKEVFYFFFAWKTARMYELIIQCTGLNASCFFLGCKSFKFSHYECSSPVNNWCTFFTSAMVTVDARAVGCSPSCSRVSCPKSPPDRLWWITRLASELPSVSEELIRLLEDMS